jgi:hypothetical protein
MSVLVPVKTRYILPVYFIFDRTHSPFQPARTVDTSTRLAMTRHKSIYDFCRNVPRWIIVRHGKGAWIQWEEDIPPRQRLLQPEATGAARIGNGPGRSLWCKTGGLATGEKSYAASKFPRERRSGSSIVGSQQRHNFGGHPVTGDSKNALSAGFFASFLLKPSTVRPLLIRASKCDITSENAALQPPKCGVPCRIFNV